MIKSKKDYKDYVIKDELANGGKHRSFYFCDELKKYLRLIRKREYLKYLQSKSKILKPCIDIYELYLKYKMHKLGVKLGFNIPLNIVGPGLRIDHWGFLAISSDAKIGKNCHIFGDVTIGVKDNSGSKAPIIGDNVTIGAGARIIGPIKIANNCKIGANAVVTHSVLEEGKTIIGIPARVIN